MSGDEIYEYVAWFHDETLPVDDQCHEWPGVVGIWARDPESAQAWGDELAKTCGDTFVRSTVEPWPISAAKPTVMCVVGQRLTAAQIGW
ncbi:hypothetical protein [Actinoplanes friuliensis]|nr:hypothetical protein [Actinoplanes friuliensis]